MSPRELGHRLLQLRPERINPFSALVLFALWAGVCVWSGAPFASPCPGSPSPSRVEDGLSPWWPPCHPPGVRCHLPWARRATGVRVLADGSVPVGGRVPTSGCVPVGDCVPSGTRSIAQPPWEPGTRGGGRATWAELRAGLAGQEDVPGPRCSHGCQGCGHLGCCASPK